MNFQLFPYVAVVFATGLVLYALWSFRLLKQRALAVQEAKRAVEHARPIQPDGADEDSDERPDTEQQMKGMISAANDMQASGLVYNRAVVQYNQLLTTYPAAFFAYMFGFEKAKLYDTAMAPGSEESES